MRVKIYISRDEINQSIQDKRDDIMNDHYLSEDRKNTLLSYVNEDEIIENLISSINFVDLIDENSIVIEE